MNTTRTLHFDTVRIARYAEVGLYTALAGILLSRAFLHSGPFTFEDSLLMILGTVFGLMASCAATPACSAWWRSRRERTGDVASTGNVPAFNRREASNDSYDVSGVHHAA